jgi:serine protease Do
MMLHRSRAPRIALRGWVVSLFALALLVPAFRADEVKTTVKSSLPSAFDKPAPTNLDDLRAIQQHVRGVVDKVKPCVVGIVVGEAQGSGVIVSADGYVLTAGHVSGRPGRDCRIVLPNGTTLKGKTMGRNIGIDSGMVKITEDDKKWPFIEMDDSASIKKGQWCLSMGHPGGYHEGRSPVVRLGRILDHSRFSLRTDCTLVGGDSGGPLFSMEGKVLGIHSRIGGEITSNIHVPVNTYRETYARLTKSDEWGGRNIGRPTSDAWMGFQVDKGSKSCKIDNVEKDSPAEKFGLKKGDVITRFDNQQVDSFDDLLYWLMNKKPDEEVAVEVNRDGEKLSLKIKLGKRAA